MLILFGALSFLAAQPAPGPAALPPAASKPGALSPSLVQVRRFAETKGEALWPGYGAATFEFLLVEAESETLLCRTSAPSGFTAAGVDNATGCARYTRPRTSLSDKLLAAMPLFGPPPTIVMGTPETTGRTPASWLRTILHEHFHQWQFSLPGYFARTDALALKGGDESGMWVLNYPFPYERPDVVAAQAAASQALADAAAARGMPASGRSWTPIWQSGRRSGKQSAKTTGATSISSSGRKASPAGRRFSWARPTPTRRLRAAP